MAKDLNAKVSGTDDIEFHFLGFCAQILIVILKTLVGLRQYFKEREKCHKPKK